jgi:type I restriction enzyme, S subunit
LFVTRRSSKKGGETPPLQNRGEREDLPEGWHWAPLNQLCSAITDGDHQPPPKSSSGIPFLVISNISSGKLDFAKTRYVSDDYHRLLQDHRKPRRGDVLFSVVGSYGIPVIVDTDQPFCFQRHIALLRAGKLLSNKYLYFSMMTNTVFNQATEVATGTAQLTVPLSGLRSIKIPLPPLPEQQEIGRRVEALFKKADAIEARYKKAKAFVDKLTQSILAKAFRGELVPQDAKDEPASVLLERIKQEHSKREADVKKRKMINKKG